MSDAPKPIFETLLGNVIEAEVNFIYTRPAPECLALIDWRLAPALGMLRAVIMDQRTPEEQREKLMDRAATINRLREAAYDMPRKGNIMEYFAEVRDLEGTLAFAQRRAS